jgi:hypothetical protein
VSNLRHCDGDCFAAKDQERRLAMTVLFFYSTVTLFARLRGWSTSRPRMVAM